VGPDVWQPTRDRLRLKGIEQGHQVMPEAPWPVELAGEDAVIEYPRDLREELDAPSDQLQLWFLDRARRILDSNGLDGSVGQDGALGDRLPHAFDPDSVSVHGYRPLRDCRGRRPGLSAVPAPAVTFDGGAVPRPR